MPIKRSVDKKGSFYQFGNQKKYYYRTEKGRLLAYKKCVKQMKAIEYSKHHK